MKYLLALSGIKWLKVKKWSVTNFVSITMQKKHLFSNLFLFSGMSCEMLHCISQIIGKLEARVTSWVRRISLNFSNGEWRVKFFCENIVIDTLDYFDFFNCPILRKNLSNQNIKTVLLEKMHILFLTPLKSTSTFYNIY